MSPLNATPGNAKQSGQRYYLLLSAWIVAIQAIYWLFLYPLAEPHSSQIDLIQPVKVEAAELAHVDRQALAAAEFEETPLPFSGCCEPANYAVRFTIEMDEVPQEGLGIVARVNADNAHLYVNGGKAFGEGRISLPDPTIERLRNLWFVAPALLHKGENTLTLVTVRASSPYTDVHPIIIGPYRAVETDTAFRRVQFNEYYLLSMGALGMLVLLAALMAWRSYNQPVAVWMVILLVGWILLLANRFVPDPWIPLEYKSLERMLGNLVIALAWLNFANEWTNRPIRWLRYGSWLIAAATALVVAAVFVLAVAPEYYDWSGTISEAVQLVLTVGAVVRIAYHLATTRDERIPEAAVFTLIISLLALDVLGEFVSDTPYTHFAFLFPVLITAFALAYIARDIRLFRSMKEFNTLVSSQLADREQEIAAGYEQRKEVERQAALMSERKRIMRDMHDGMGSRLTSLAAQLRYSDESTPLDRDELAEELIAALDELRLIVDSLDTAGDDLGMALGAFRTRMQPKLDAASIALDWSLADDAASTELSATSILDVYRVLQEACTNILRHSGGDRISITLFRAGDGRATLQIADNGKGLADGDVNCGGHGLSNMRRRARKLGGKLELANQRPGLAVRLTLPES